MASRFPQDAGNKFEDLSGVNVSDFSNPYDALIQACHDDPVEIQARYDTHRSSRNTQQKAKLLSADFSGLLLDPILQRLEDDQLEPGFVDPRYCLVFWARPTQKIRNLTAAIQQKLLQISPNLWLMPPEKQHLTALEIAHSLTDPEITTLLGQIEHKLQELTDYTLNHHPRLLKPLLSYDGAAVALSFLPAASPDRADDKYTYHHLRRDLFNLASSTGVKIDSRYVVPSSHITVARFITAADHDGPEKMQKWVAKIDEINQWLVETYWPKKDDGDIEEGGEWIVGGEKGLECRQGTLWYGGGEMVRLGKGI